MIVILIVIHMLPDSSPGPKTKQGGTETAPQDPRLTAPQDYITGRDGD